MSNIYTLKVFIARKGTPIDPIFLGGANGWGTDKSLSYKSTLE